MCQGNCPSCEKVIYYFVGPQVVCCHCGDEVIPDNEKAVDTGDH